MNQLIDIGANLTHKLLFKRIDLLLEQAKQNRIGHIIVTGTSLKSTGQAIQISRSDPSFLSATCGIHPHNANLLTNEIGVKMKEMASDPGVVAIGECGLDYDRMISSSDDQRKAFSEQIEWAIQFKKPLFLHCRGDDRCFLDFIAILKKYQYPAGVVHCFTGDLDQAVMLTNNGYYIGLTGWISDSRRNHDVLKAITSIPRDRILLETDSPYLHPLRKKELNTPAQLIHVAQFLSHLLEWEMEPMIEQIKKNTTTIFPLLQVQFHDFKNERSGADVFK